MNHKKITAPKLVGLVLFAILIGIILQPRLASEYIYPIRAYNLGSFIQKSALTQDINRKDLWEFRDLYGIGKFSLDTKMTSNHPLRERMRVLDFVPQLTYTSRFIESLGGQTQLSSIPTDSALPDDYFIIKTPSRRLFKTENGYILVTLTPLSEEERINGFINKVELVKDKNFWLEVTKITK